MAVTSFSGKVAAITGAGSGMGRALAVLLSEAGCDVAISDINQDSLDETVGMRSPAVRSTSRVVNVANRDEVKNFANATAAFIVC